MERLALDYFLWTVILHLAQQDRIMTNILITWTTQTFFSLQNPSADLAGVSSQKQNFTGTRSEKLLVSPCHFEQEPIMD